MGGPSKKDQWPTHDAACTSCRTRKIRCGREKPMCRCCVRDEVECVYSPALKRVNHVKVMSQSLGDIQDRVVKMQGELSLLTIALKRSNIAAHAELPLVRDFSTSRDDASEVASIKVGHVERNSATQTERYHGPRTLVSLCREFAADLASSNGITNNEVVTGLVKHLLNESTQVSEDSLDLLGPRSGQAELDTCNLPPKHLLSAMLDSFVKQADYSTDIFCRRSIQEAIERVYEEPLTPVSETWALCFNLIILLTLGSDNPVRSDDPFVRPMLQAAQAMAGKSSSFMSTRFVNVQALALLSQFVQQYHTDNQTLGDSFFARACLLATESGLHQADGDLSQALDLSVLEAEERQKVFKSLYICDRFSMIAYGKPAWFPSANHRISQAFESCDKSSEQGGIASTQSQPARSPHWELAGIQDELRCLICSRAGPPVSASGKHIALAQLLQKLNTWSATYKIPSPSRPTTVRDISLHLAFLGTRIRLLESGSLTDGAAGPASTQVIDDARLGCLLIAFSCNQSLDQGLTSKLNNLLSKPHNTSKDFATSSYPSTTQSTSVSSTTSYTFPSQFDASPTAKLPAQGRSNFSSAQDPTPAPLPLHRITNVFPIAAVFALARHILGIDNRLSNSHSAPTPVQGDEERTTEIAQDILLLEALLFCFRTKKPTSSIPDHVNPSNDAIGSKLGRTIQNLLNIIHASMNPTSHIDAANDDNGNVDHEEMDVGDEYDEDMYTFEPMVSLDSSLPPGDFSMDMPDPSSYSSNGISPHLNMPMQSPWDTPPDSISGSSTAMHMWSAQDWSTQVPITPPSNTMPEGQFDISNFLNEVERSNMCVQDGGQDQGMPTHQQQQQQHQIGPVSEAPARKRPKKRARANDHQVHV